MKALILNSGLGRRMGEITSQHPKCMTEIDDNKETIISRQLKMLKLSKIEEVIITTGPFKEELIRYINSLNLGLKYIFINNSIYYKTNYIYSIYLAKKHLNDNLLLIHGDLVFTQDILDECLSYKSSCMAVSSTIPLPEKDFKAVINSKGQIIKVGIEFFDNALAAQPLYKLHKADWLVWLDNIISYCENNNISCYAEDALNDVADKCDVFPLDFKDKLCTEIDTEEDLKKVRKQLSR